jgi:hypothetical protein
MRAVLLVLTLLAPATAAATVILPADFATVVNGADLIVAGRVVDIRSQLTEARTIESYVTVAVDQTLKGSTVRTTVFRVPNGTVGRYRRITIGAPEFDEGDRVVLFLHARAGRIPTLFGLSQGVYRIAQTDGGAMVLPAPVMSRGVAAERVVRGDPARRPMPLDDFIRAVQTAMVAR